MNGLFNLIWGNDIYRRIILSTFILIAAWIVRRGARAIILGQIPDDSPHIHTVRSVTSYVVTFATILVLLNLWLQRAGDLSVALGIFAAGLAFALQEVIGSIAGWITIVTGQPFTVGNRIETGGIRGDVVDISVLRTKLMEIGNWMNGDHNTGRIVTVSNAFIFKEPLFNYSRHLDYIWDEIAVPITYGADRKRAMEIMAQAAREHPAYLDLLPQAEEQRRRARRELVVKLTSLEPRVFLKLTDNWIELGLIYPVQIDARRKFRSDVSQAILTQFEAEGIQIASQTIAIVQMPDSNPAPPLRPHVDP